MAPEPDDRDEIDFTFYVNIGGLWVDVRLLEKFLPLILLFGCGVALLFGLVFALNWIEHHVGLGLFFGSMAGCVAAAGCLWWATTSYARRLKRGEYLAGSTICFTWAGVAALGTLGCLILIAWEPLAGLFFAMVMAVVGALLLAWGISKRELEKLEQPAPRAPYETDEAFFERVTQNSIENTNADLASSSEKLNRPMTSPQSIRVACRQCGKRFSGAKDRIQLIKKCPKCGVIPFDYRQLPTKE